MKTLADLKKHCTEYLWKLEYNSLYPGVIPVHQKDFRRVTQVKSRAFALYTNVNGLLKDSWIEFPKATEMKITKKQFSNCYELTITRDLDPDVKSFRPMGTKRHHVMIYTLKPIDPMELEPPLDMPVE